MIIFTRPKPEPMTANNVQGSQPACPPWWQQGWQQIQSLYPPGRTFTFLTLPLAVTSYGICNGQPSMIAKYINTSGEICCEQFTTDEIAFLLALDSAQIPTSK